VDCSCNCGGYDGFARRCAIHGFFFFLMLCLKCQSATAAQKNNHSAKSNNTGRWPCDISQRTNSQLVRPLSPLIKAFMVTIPILAGAKQVLPLLTFWHDVAILRTTTSQAPCNPSGHTVC
jgi:hypothetical protein